MKVENIDPRRDPDLFVGRPVILPTIRGRTFDDSRDRQEF